MSVDTACSSSLVATHLAHAHVQKTGGSAIVGGINMMLSHATSAMFLKASASQGLLVPCLYVHC